MGLWDGIMKCMKRWTVVFKALANTNRLKIIRLLSDGRRVSVGEIARVLRISFNCVSNHLVLLEELEVLESEGTAGHVFYFLNPRMPSDFSNIISFLK